MEVGGQLAGADLVFHRVGPRGQTQVIGLGQPYSQFSILYVPIPRHWSLNEGTSMRYDMHAGLTLKS